MKQYFISLLICLLSFRAMAQFPEILQGDLTANDKRLTMSIDKSKQNELTIASFNIRNFGARNRSLKDYANLVDLVDEVDIILIQEAGLGVYYGPTISDIHRKRMQAVIAVLRIYFGNDWIVTSAPEPSGVGNGIETTILAYRKKGLGFNISANWQQYVDLGEKRDMAIFQITLSKDVATKNLFLGSVHLTPEDPDRGTQMLKVADWIVSQNTEWAIAMGDFNWGYKKSSGIENYRGEKKIKELHEAQSLFQLFYHLSYFGKSDLTRLRTNLGFRAGGYFYDQFILTPVLADQLADGGQLLKDAGIIAFDIQSKMMKKAIQKSHKKRQYGLDRYIKNGDIEPSSNQTVYDKTIKEIVNSSANDATFLISDHRIIWMQLKVW